MFFKVRFYLPAFVFLFFCQSVLAQFPFTESFKNSTADHLFFGGTPNAYLTAGSVDPEGDGYLRLTNNDYGQTGFAYSTVKFPSSKGFTVDFEYYTYGGHTDPGADGITFFLFDATANPFSIGAFGGALGYAQRVYEGKIIGGVSKGYLGVGIDEWGNFSNPTEGRQGGIGQRPNSITLRGAGNGFDETPNNYPYLTGVQTTTLPASFGIAGGNRNATNSSIDGYRKVIITLEPSIPGYNVTVQMQLTEGGVSRTTTLINKYHYQTPAPPYLRFGFASSTGGADNFHEIRNIHFNLPLDAVVIPPTANDDSFSIAQNDLSGNVKKAIVFNDVANNAGSNIDTSSVDLDPATPGIQDLKLIPGKGTFSVRDGKINFIPVNGTISGTFSTKYTITDDFGGDPSNEATITVTIIPQPKAEDDIITAIEDTPITFDITTNDAGTGGKTLDLNTIDLDPATPGQQKTRTIPGKGTFTANNDGTITFTPIPDFNGVVDPINYTIADNEGTISNSASVKLTITGVNDTPVAVNDEASTNEDTPVTFNIISNDTDADGNSTIDPASIDLDSSTTGQQKTKTITEKGTFTANPDGTVTFTPVLNFNGAVDGVQYVIADNSGTASNPAKISVTVTAVNDAPIAVDDVAETNQGMPVTFSVTANDTDPEGNNTIDKTSVDLDPLTPGQQQTKTITGQGTFTANNDGTVTFTPIADFSGTVTAISYTIKDNDGAVCSAASIRVTVNSGSPSKVGLAKKLTSVNQAGYQSYDLSFKFTITNFGNDNLENVALDDDLSQAFPGTEFTISTLTATGNLKINNLYDGRANTNLLSSESVVGSEETAEVELKIHVKTINQNGLFKNTATIEAVSSVTGQTISDTSTDGLKPDPETPGDVSSSVETEINLTGADIFIPSGFSPNRDGINDKLIIDNPLSKRIALEIYNRWGNRVYKNVDYKNDWEGICSEGIHVGEEIPEGTYFYIVVIENGSKQVGQLTIKR